MIKLGAGFGIVSVCAVKAVITGAVLGFIGYQLIERRRIANERPEVPEELPSPTN